MIPVREGNGISQVKRLNKKKQDTTALISLRAYTDVTVLCLEVKGIDFFLLRDELHAFR